MENMVIYNGERETVERVAEITKLDISDLRDGMKFSDGDIYEAIFIARYGKQRMEKLEAYYRELGLEKYWAGKERRTIPNLHAAIIIVESFFKDQNIDKGGDKSTEEIKKNALNYLLKHPFLKIGRIGSLIQIVNAINTEKIPNEIAIKIYKTIIYLSVKSSVDITGMKVTYLELLQKKSFKAALENIKKIINMEKDVPISEVLKALGVTGYEPKGNKIKTKKPMTEMEQRRVISYYEEIGLSEFINVDGQLIYSYENLKQASSIVEKYFGESISKEEKRAVLMCILGNPFLRTNNVRKICDLADLVDKLKITGLEERDIFAIIINCGIEGKILNYYYGEVLCGNDDFISKVETNQDSQGVTEVCPEILGKAVSKAKDKEAEASICEYYKRLGLGGLIMQNVSGKLRYPESELNMARQITEGYFKGEEIPNQVKQTILRSLLSADILKLNRQVKFDKLASVINRMKEKGINDKEIYGLLINASFATYITNYSCTMYSQVLQKPEIVDSNLLAEYKTIVTPEILDAVMRNTSRRGGVQLADRALETLTPSFIPVMETRKEISNLIKMRESCNKDHGHNQE